MKKIFEDDMKFEELRSRISNLSKKNSNIMVAIIALGVIAVFAIATAVLYKNYTCCCLDDFDDDFDDEDDFVDDDDFE